MSVVRSPKSLLQNVTSTWSINKKTKWNYFLNTTINIHNFTDSRVTYEPYCRENACMHTTL